MILINLPMKQITPVITMFIDIIVIFSLSPFVLSGTNLYGFCELPKKFQLLFFVRQFIFFSCCSLSGIRRKGNYIQEKEKEELSPHQRTSSGISQIYGLNNFLLLPHGEKFS